jgi:DNA topoisomerase-3
MGGEEFSCTGVIVEQLNYLEVFHYEKWSDKELPSFSENESFTPSILDLSKGRTSAP